jgi:hypothetical protein
MIYQSVDPSSGDSTGAGIREFMNVKSVRVAG